MDPNTMTLLLLPLMAVAFYFLLIRPQRKRAQAQQKLLEQMQPGERVVTHSGIFGTLVSTGQRQSVLQIAPGVEITVLKQAVARVVQPTDEDDADDELADAATVGAVGGAAADSTEPADADAPRADAAQTESLDATEPAYDPYRPGEPSTLDLPDQPAVTTPQGQASDAPEQESGIRDVTSNYFQRPTAGPESSQPTQSSKDS